MEFFFDDVTTNGPVSVIDIGISSTAEDTALICRSEASGSAGERDWYLHLDQQTTAETYRIQTGGDRGWRRGREVSSGGFHQVILRRNSVSETALEGLFTCRIVVSGDSNQIRSVYVLYPSELSITDMRMHGCMYKYDNR